MWKNTVVQMRQPINDHQELKWIANRAIKLDEDRLSEILWAKHLVENILKKNTPLEINIALQWNEELLQELSWDSQRLIWRFWKLALRLLQEYTESMRTNETR